MKNMPARRLIGIPLAVLLLCGACGRSNSDTANPAKSEKPKPASPPAAMPSTSGSDGSSGGEAADAPKSVSLVIQCAQELRGPVEELAQDIRARLGLECRLECGGGPDLLSQIKRMRQGDILVLDHSDYLAEAEKEGIVKAGSAKTLGYLEPVLLVAKGNPKGVKGLEDFRRVGDRNNPLAVGVADPEKCGLGLITQQILAKNKMDWAPIEAQSRLKVTAEHLLIFPATSRAIDLCIVRHAEAARVANSCDTIPIPPKQNLACVVTAAPLVCSAHPEDAQRVVDYMAGDLGKVVFKKFHYKQAVDPVLLVSGQPPPAPAKK